MSHTYFQQIPATHTPGKTKNFQKKVGHILAQNNTVYQEDNRACDQTFSIDKKLGRLRLLIHTYNAIPRRSHNTLYTRAWASPAL